MKLTVMSEKMEVKCNGVHFHIDSRRERNSSLLRPACSRIARIVPFGSVLRLGTMTSLVLPGPRLTKAM